MLSIAINVKNGAKYLEVCLNALYKFDDVVLLDNYSTDNTLEIAKRYTNVRIFQAEFSGMGNLRNIASGFCKNDWVFFVDSDEVVNQELVTTLLNLEFKNGNVYSILRHNYYDGKLVDSSAWENDWINRIYNRLDTKYMEYSVHESINVSGMNVIKIENGNIYHFPYEKISELLDKTQFYSTLYAKQNLGKKKASLCMIPFRALVMFIKCYLLKGGFRDGYEGFVVSTFNAIGVLVKYFKLYELEHKKPITLLLDLNGINSNEALKIIKNINQQKSLPTCIALIDDNADNSYTKLLLVRTEVFKNSLDLNQDENIHKLLNIAENSSMAENVVYVKNYNYLENNMLIASCKQDFIKNKNITIVRK